VLVEAGDGAGAANGRNQTQLFGWTFLRMSPMRLRVVACGEAKVSRDVSPAEFLQLASERAEAALPLRVVLGNANSTPIRRALPGC
jgi:hypothetical protein